MIVVCHESAVEAKLCSVVRDAKCWGDHHLRKVSGKLCCVEVLLLLIEPAKGQRSIIRKGLSMARVLHAYIHLKHHQQQDS